MDLSRFVDAQRGSYADALAELRNGRKASHWMWFVFPQIAGLGHSPMARVYALASIDEARAWLAHPVLGARLADCIAAVLAHSDRTAEAIFGPVDAMKFRSSMTLFEAAADDPAPFAQAILSFYGGVRDAATLDILEGRG
jgi:uncharacterized protein (DUF1810 family)